MKDITFWPTDAQMPRVATVYARAERPHEAVMPNDTMSRNVYFRGSGGLYSTAEDYIPLGIMLANGGELNGKRLLSRKTVEMMSAPRTSGHAARAAPPAKATASACASSPITPRAARCCPMARSAGPARRARTSSSIRRRS